MNDMYFLQMIQELRKEERVMLYGNIMQIGENECEEVQVFLREEYQKESLNWPHRPPPFDPEVAVWAAKIIYFSAQLILYREHEKDDIEQLLTEFPGVRNPAAHISADLCLRFLPHFIYQLNLIDPEDELITKLETILQKWPYSVIKYSGNVAVDFGPEFLENKCLHQLCIDRIIKYKKLKLALHPKFKSGVTASLGMYQAQFWKEFNLETQNHE